MSLIAFHKFLIATAILFSFGLAVRQWLEFQGTRDALTLITALVFAGAAGGLVVYLARLRKFLKMPEALSEPKPFLPSEVEQITESQDT